MACEKISLKGLGMASGVLWAAAFFMVASVNIVFPGYGSSFLFVMDSLYPGYDFAPQISMILIGTGYALVDGFVAGALFAGLYNIFSSSKKI